MDIFIPEDVFRIIIDKIYELNHSKIWKSIVTECAITSFIRLIDPDWSIYKKNENDEKILDRRLFCKEIANESFRGNSECLYLVDLFCENSITETWIDEEVLRLKLLK